MAKTFKFIKEQKLGEKIIVYFTEQNGIFVAGSLSSDYDVALARYESLCKGEPHKIVEVLQTCTIE
jgi:predicted Mrr-cat superfamily restriction endonuclease